MYSKADELLLPSACFKQHAEYAEGNGYVVASRVKFPDIQYVAHARSYLDKYWARIMDTWEAG
jgi:hypothetical protein